MQAIGVLYMHAASHEVGYQRSLSSSQHHPSSVNVWTSAISQMDPLSVTPSVVAVLQAANTVISICYDFRAAIRDSPWALTRITSSINELHLILSRLEQVANETELSFDKTNVARLSTLEVLCREGGAISKCFQELVALEKKLVPGSWAGEEGSKRRALVQSIGWQFKGKECRRDSSTVGRLQKYLESGDYDGSSGSH